MPEPAIPREPTKRVEHDDLVFTLVIALVALLPRLFAAIAWAREPVWDGHYYHFGAQRIAAGLGYSEDVLVRGVAVWKPWCHYPVGYSGLLGGAYKVFGSGLTTAPIVNAVLGTLLVVVVHRLARYYVSGPRARVAAVVAAFHPGLIVYSAVVMTEPLAALLLTLAAWVSARFGPRWLGATCAGAVLGLATLVRPSTLLAAPLLALSGPRPWWKALARGALATVVALALVLPWTFRNCKVMDGCALVSTNGGWNLAIGALYDSGRFETLRASDGCPVVTGQVQQDRCWAKVGREAISRDPLRWLSLIPKKLGHTWDHESFAIEYLREADPRAWPEPRRVLARNVLSTFHRALLFAASLAVVAWVGLRNRRDLRFVSQLLLLLALVGLAVNAAVDIHHPFYWIALVIPLIPLLRLPGAPRQGPVGRYLLGLVLATSFTHAIFFGDDRYHLVVSPILCILAAAALRRHAAPAAGPPSSGQRPAQRSAAPGDKHQESAGASANATSPTPEALS